MAWTDLPGFLDNILKIKESLGALRKADKELSDELTAVRENNIRLAAECNAINKRHDDYVRATEQVISQLVAKVESLQTQSNNVILQSALLNQAIENHKERLNQVSALSQVVRIDHSHPRLSALGNGDGSDNHS